jgi:putative ABC transport system ATP-binding protein
MTVTESAPATEAEVVCAGVVHVYLSEQGPVAALRNVDLVVGAGEMLAIVGPSGSGKTTLMSLLSGLMAPTAGSILIAGQDITRLDEPGLSRLRATQLSMLLQDPLANLLPYATVTENVAFAARGARRRGWPLRWTAEELVERLGMGDLGARPVHRLSAGQQNRAAIASALATSPRVLLADEPTGQLDPDSRDSVITALREARELSGATVIVVTHDSTVATALPRSLAISHGAIGAEGRGAERFAVVGGGGTVQLPPEIAARHPSGTLLTIRMADGEIILSPRDPPASRVSRDGGGEDGDGDG